MAVKSFTEGLFCKDSLFSPLRHTTHTHISHMLLVEESVCGTGKIYNQKNFLTMFLAKLLRLICCAGRVSCRLWRIEGVLQSFFFVPAGWQVGKSIVFFSLCTHTLVRLYANWNVSFEHWQSRETSSDTFAYRRRKWIELFTTPGCAGCGKIDQEGSWHWPLTICQSAKHPEPLRELKVVPANARAEGHSSLRLSRLNIQHEDGRFEEAQRKRERELPPEDYKWNGVCFETSFPFCCVLLQNSTGWQLCELRRANENEMRTHPRETYYQALSSV